MQGLLKLGLESQQLRLVRTHGQAALHQAERIFQCALLSELFRFSAQCEQCLPLFDFFFQRQQRRVVRALLQTLLYLLIGIGEFRTIQQCLGSCQAFSRCRLLL